MNAEFFEAIADIEKEKGIPRKYMYDKINQAMLTAFRRDNPECGDNVEVLLEEEKKQIDMVVHKTVVEDVEDPKRRANLIACFDRLFQMGVIPVINENDAVAVEEIVYGDNDSLSAIVARLVNADTLFILSDIDALYDADPRRDPNARRIPRVREITPELRAACTGAGSGLGTGGMETKLRAAEIAREGGISTVIINGTPPDNLYLALEGADIGTIFEGGMGDA